MRYLQTIVLSSFLFICIAGISYGGNSEIIDDSITYDIEEFDILLAHHAGNRPDWATDIEDQVHGGDNPNGMDSDTDPNGDNPPDPQGQPDEDPASGGNGSD